MTDWPVSVGRKQFKPIPDSWVGVGHDAHADADGTRIFAVSVGAVPDTRDVLAIRYVHPRSGQTLTVRTPGAPNPSGEGLVPASLANDHDWPRSRLADADPDGSARDVEMDHLRELWHELVSSIPAPDKDDRELVADGGRDVTSTDGVERRDPREDPRACSKCGVHIGFLGDEYCDPCAREIGAKPPLERCMHCGQRAPQEQMEAIDISPDDEYYPTIRYLCRGCSGGGPA